MFSKFRFACAAAAGFVWTQMGAFAATPAAPANLCITDSSGTSCVSATTAVSGKKWNPGHYVRANAVAFPDSDGARFAAYDLTKNNPNLKGGLITVPWGTIEKSEGVYDFSQIDKDLAYLKKLGKKLMIEVWWQKYGCTNGSDTRYFPAYITAAGGVGTVNGDCTIKMNESHWADRYIALQKALAARYDGDSDVEQTIITETASTSAYEFTRILPEVAKAWPKTVTIIYMNWVDTGQLAIDLAALCAQYGAGIGAPDILPPKPISPVGEDHGSRALRGAGMSSFYSDGTSMQNFGNIDYRGKIPVSYSYEALHGITPAALIPYTRDTLKATHVVWSVTEDLSALMNWSTGALVALETTAYPIVTALPSSLSK